MRIRNRINPPKSRRVQNRCQEHFLRIQFDEVRKFLAVRIPTHVERWERWKQSAKSHCNSVCKRWRQGRLRKSAPTSCRNSWKRGKLRSSVMETEKTMRAKLEDSQNDMRLRDDRLAEVNKALRTEREKLRVGRFTHQTGATCLVPRTHEPKWTVIHHATPRFERSFGTACTRGTASTTCSLVWQSRGLLDKCPSQAHRRQAHIQHYGVVPR